jgi:oligoendopeptidase F
VTEVAAGLLDRPLLSPEELENWLLDWSELFAAVYAGYSRRNIATTRDTIDPALREDFLAYDRDVMSAWRRIEDRLNRKLLDSPHREALDPRLGMLVRRKQTDADLFRDENVGLLTEETAIAKEYEQLTGGLLVPFRGEELTPQRVSLHLVDRDRATREEAWRAIRDTFGAHREEIDAIFDRLFALRRRIATNAGCADFREYRFKKTYRFDYGPQHCAQYRDAVAKVVVPAQRELASRHAARLGLEKLRPWDTARELVAPRRIRPFEEEEGFKTLLAGLFGDVDPRFADDFDILVRNELLDLMSRPGKAPGGYNAGLADIRLPFIFMNAVGRHQDVMTLLHEGGHAFHTIATRGEPVIEIARAPMEFNEVASMAMELFGIEHLGTRYPAEDARFAYTSFLEGRLGTLSMVAVIDGFQHWLYERPDHTSAERTVHWLELSERFSSGIDWNGLDEQRRYGWHSTRHIFLAPFYFIEYGIALIGALQLWSRYRRDPAGAIDAYRAALALGGTRPLPEIFETAGIRFAMDEETIRTVTDEVLAAINEAG